MEQRNNLVLQGTETFSRGQLDNVALDGGALVLDSVAGRCLQYGSYTTPEFAMPAFCNLNVSWNASATLSSAPREKVSVPCSTRLFRCSIRTSLLCALWTAQCYSSGVSSPRSARSSFSSWAS